MTKSKESEARLMYELSKLTNTSKQITTDFIETVVLFLFRDYLEGHPRKEEFLDLFMDTWEKNLVRQKEFELDTLTSQYSSMNDLAVGSLIANSENIEIYKKDVHLLKEILAAALVNDEVEDED